MEAFSALLAICAGNSPVTGEFPSQRPVTRSFDVFFDLRLDERLSKQSWGWWFETPLHSAHYDVIAISKHNDDQVWVPFIWVPRTVVEGLSLYADEMKVERLSHAKIIKVITGLLVAITENHCVVYETVHLFIKWIRIVPSNITNQSREINLTINPSMN